VYIIECDEEMTRDDITAGLIISVVDAAGYTLITLAHTLRGVGDEKKVVCLRVDGVLKRCVFRESLHAYTDLSDATIEKTRKFMND